MNCYLLYLYLFFYTINSRYCGHSRDRELESSIERVRNNGGLSQSNVYKKISGGDLAAIRISGVSVIARCLQGEYIESKQWNYNSLETP